MNNTFLAGAFVTGLVLWTSLHKTNKARTFRQKHFFEVQIQTWEGEGGHLIAQTNKKLRPNRQK